LQSAEIAEPVLRANDVLVQIHAASVNVLDSKIKKGDFKLILPYKPPITLGHDVAGIVIKVGLGVKQFKTGDEVYARPADQFVQLSQLKFTSPFKFHFCVARQTRFNISRKGAKGLWLFLSAFAPLRENFLNLGNKILTY
jgi:Alcohol dehydrogenase GroES-like domain